ncbi:MAG TPA: hypothetical protein VIL49_04685 [Capillimicrobium sp.]|jgi:hypothetical protein
MPSPRVRCRACAFEWFGATASHGLRIIGSCTRCGGELDFLVPEEADDQEPTITAGSDAAEQRPATVLGTPTSWAR